MIDLSLPITQSEQSPKWNKLCSVASTSSIFSNVNYEDFDLDDDSYDDEKMMNKYHDFFLEGATTRVVSVSWITVKPERVHLFGD